MASPASLQLHKAGKKMLIYFFGLIFNWLGNLI